MRSDMYSFLATLTCFYWMASFCVLCLRIAVPRFSGLVRYGGRCIPGAGGGQKGKGHPSSERPVSYLGCLVRVAVCVLERSVCCQFRVSRKNSFCAFYITGIVSALVLLLSACCSSNGVEWNTLFLRVENVLDSGASSGAADTSHNNASCSVCILLLGCQNCYELLPLVAFLVHCTVRLWECLHVHHFRGGPADSVTLFAALAGCSFYVFAACSSSSLLFHACAPDFIRLRWRSNGLGTKWSPGLLLSLPLLIGLLFWLHLALQVVQVFHHRVLAGLRERTRAAARAADCQQGDVCCRAFLKENKHASESCAGGGAALSLTEAQYHFPYVYLFRYVSEPHYTCEIMMYAVNLTSITLSLLLDSNTAFNIEWEELRGVCETVPSWAHYGAPLGVLVFSLFNLAITACEHRRFWNFINSERAKTEQERLPRWNLFCFLW
ncbi:hypothetical protein TRVL_02904 [Trypanosoma vivax]|uniref:Uncharacterized protein n=1 Tax=Trypanosoma vivax (strain Y486) TaxID=1055687 RepID=G0UAA1_TRYVY|nr:hypothetical protein TRVL_02904 [Trypanosoma vivax]CCC52734.1 conserved hypothetical protein [Trypanosoma vivax Y486]